MKVTIYEQKDVPIKSEGYTLWVHYIYLDSSGWIGVSENLDEDDLDICKESIREMETKSGTENGLDAEIIQEEIDSYRYNRTELDNGTTVIVATPYVGEATIFIV